VLERPQRAIQSLGGCGAGGANWLVLVLLGYVLPIVFSVLGAIYVYIRTVSDQTISAVLGTIVSLVAVGISLALYWIFRQEQLLAAASSEVLDNVIAEVDRQAWIKERLKEEPELEQRMEELREEYEREHPS
jgi:hypothetical protein